MKFLLSLLFVLSFVPTTVEAAPPEKGDRAITIFACLEKGAIKNLLANAIKGKHQFHRAFEMYVKLGSCMPFPGPIEVHVEERLIEGETEEGTVWAVQLQSTKPDKEYYTLLIANVQGQGV